MLNTSFASVMTTSTAFFAMLFPFVEVAKYGDFLPLYDSRPSPLAHVPERRPHYFGVSKWNQATPDIGVAQNQKCKTKTEINKR